MNIRPIETRYDGYLFRSRLEARWAVFFDALDVPYEYELEGFDIRDGDLDLHYLPDFYLPTLDTFVEVKPNIVIPRAQALKFVEFHAVSGNNVLLTRGEPGHALVLLTCQAEDALLARFAFDGDRAVIIGGPLPPITLEHVQMTVDDERIHQAIVAARSARFEFNPHNLIQ